MITQDEKDFILSSLNQTFHNTVKKLEGKDLGDIEREMLEQTKVKSKALMMKLDAEVIKKPHVWAILGETAVRKLDEDESISTEESSDGYAKRFEFETEGEKKAFMLGVIESNGWLDTTVLSEQEYEYSETEKTVKRK